MNLHAFHPQESVTSFGWSGSAALGGYLIHVYGFQLTFYITATMQVGRSDLALKIKNQLLWCVTDVSACRSLAIADNSQVMLSDLS